MRAPRASRRRCIECVRGSAGCIERPRTRAPRIAGATPEPRPGKGALAGGALHHALAASRARGGGVIGRICPILLLPGAFREPCRRELFAIATLVDEVALQR